MKLYGLPLYTNAASSGLTQKQIETQSTYIQIELQKGIGMMIIVIGSWTK